VPRDSPWDDLPPAPVRLMPTIAFPTATGTYTESVVDSSPLIDRLEQRHHRRSLVPTDPVVAFVDAVVEDYADEWVTKAMYHYRWTYPDAIAKAGALLPLDHDLQLSSERWAMASAYITERQIGRRALVGSTEANRPIIESSYLRLLNTLQHSIAERLFLVGDRPGRGDFGLFGQLSQLAGWDPPSARLAAEQAPRVVTWTMRADDLSWLPVDGDAGWVGRDALGAPMLALLAEIGRTYAPFMVANAAALDAGADEVVCSIDGAEYRQGPFKYQGKCLQWLRQRYDALGHGARPDVDRLLDGTGCEQLFS
jgi:glutathione S-transferase